MFTGSGVTLYITTYMDHIRAEQDSKNQYLSIEVLVSADCADCEPGWPQNQFFRMDGSSF